LGFPPLMAAYVRKADVDLTTARIGRTATASGSAHWISLQLEEIDMETQKVSRPSARVE
jgi:hypothetical protein